MAGMVDDRFKRYQEVGNDFFDTARTRAEEFLRELAKATDSTQKQAQDQVDDLVAAGKRGTDQLLEVIRREISTQLAQLGLVTRDEFEALERRVAAQPAASPAKAAPGATKAAPAKKAPATKKAAPAKKAPAATKAAPAKKAPATKKAANGSAGAGPSTSA